MRLSNRLIANAATTYLRFGVSLLLGVFFIWYVIGRIGMVGFGMVALTATMYSFSAALDSAIRFGLIRELAAAIASGDPERVRVSTSSAFAFCAPAAGVFGVLGVLLALVALAGVFNLPADPPGLRHALTALLLAEAVYAAIRLFFAPFTQALYASQHIGLDNLLFGAQRLLLAVSAVLVLGVLLPDAPLDRQLYGFAVSRVTLQLLDVGLGIWLAKRCVRGLSFRRSAIDRNEFRAIRGTVWHSGQVTLLMDLNVHFIAILINFIFGVAYNGLWQVVVQLGGWAQRFALGLLRGIEPVATSMHDAGRRGASLDLMERTIRYQTGTVLPVAAALCLYMEPILDLWIGGRMAARVAEMGITASQAIRIIAVMAFVHLAASVVRASMFGVQRMLYGIGEVRSYSWFAKYAALLNVGLGAILMRAFDTPVAGPAVLLAVYLIYYPGIVLVAAKRRAGLPIGQALARSIPRPLIATALLCVPLLAVRPWFVPLTLGSLAVLMTSAGLLYGILVFCVILTADERARLRQLLSSGTDRLRGRRPPPGDN